VIRNTTLCALMALSVASAALAAPRPHTRHGRSRPPRETVLEQTLDRVVELRREKRSPTVIFDLDDTLFAVAPRTRRIFSDWAAHLPAQYDRYRSAFQKLDPDTMPYDPEKVLDLAGLSDPLLRRSAMRQWHLFFFSNRYLREDRPAAGARSFLDRLRHAKARIVYLTGRDQLRMGLGTIDQIREAGFPPVDNARVLLMLKPDKRMSDLAFKERALADIRARGTVVAGFDNEPANVNLFKRHFPDAIIVHLDTVYSAKAPGLDPGISRIRDFLPGRP